MPIIKVKSDGNPTYVIGDPMKQVHMGNNKSLVDRWCTIKLKIQSLSLWCKDSDLTGTYKVELCS